MMDKTKYPYWSVAALSPSNPFYVAGPLGACGQCFEVQCVNSGGKYAVGSQQPAIPCSNWIDSHCLLDTVILAYRPSRRPSSFSSSVLVDAHKRLFVVPDFPDDVH